MKFYPVTEDFFEEDYVEDDVNLADVYEEEWAKMGIA